jgi:hypothetical protein
VRLSKLGALFGATAIAVTGLALPLAQSASAAVAPHVVCSKIAATTTLKGANGTTATAWSSCTPAALSAGGSSSVTVPVSKLLGNLTSTITWKGGKGTTQVTLKYTTQKTKTGCPAGTAYRTIITGTTKASTGAAKAVVKVGETISAEVCTKVVTTTKYTSTLKPNTKFKI